MRGIPSSDFRLLTSFLVAAADGAAGAGNGLFVAILIKVCSTLRFSGLLVAIVWTNFFGALTVRSALAVGASLAIATLTVGSTGTIRTALTTEVRALAAFIGVTSTMRLWRAAALTALTAALDGLSR